MSVSTVKRAIDDLARYGLLTNEFRCRENGSHDGSLARSIKIEGYEVDKNGVRKTK